MTDTPGQAQQTPPTVDDLTPAQLAKLGERFGWELRELPRETASWAACVYHAIEVSRERLTRARAPVWMLQRLNGMVEDFGDALERIRPLEKHG